MVVEVPGTDGFQPSLRRISSVVGCGPLTSPFLPLSFFWNCVPGGHRLFRSLHLFFSSSFFFLAKEKGPKRTAPFGTEPVFPRIASGAGTGNWVPYKPGRCTSTTALDGNMRQNPPLHNRLHQGSSSGAGDLLFRRFFGTTGDACFWRSRLMVSGAFFYREQPPTPPPWGRKIDRKGPSREMWVDPLIAFSGFSLCVFV